MKATKISKADCIAIQKIAVDAVVRQKMDRIIAIVGEENLTKLADSTKAQDFQKATQRVYDNSAIEVQVLK
jgi:hypothetical protein